MWQYHPIEKYPSRSIIGSLITMIIFSLINQSGVLFLYSKIYGKIRIGRLLSPDETLLKLTN